MDTAAWFRTLGETTRHALLRRLLEGPATVGQLVEAVQAEQTNVSHHLRGLREAGLVTCRRAGRHQVYHLSDPEVAAVLADADALARRLDRVRYAVRFGRPVDATYVGYG